MLVRLHTDGPVSQVLESPLYTLCSFVGSTENKSVDQFDKNWNEPVVGKTACWLNGVLLQQACSLTFRVETEGWRGVSTSVPNMHQLHVSVFIFLLLFRT